MTGLTGTEARRRLDRDGANEIARARGTPAWRMLVRQLASPLIGLLAVALAVSAALGEGVDAIAIGALVLLNAVIGFVQEYSAQNAVFALRAMTAPRARAVRDGAIVEVPAAEVVVGDVVVVEAGDVVPADARLLTAHALATNEAALTGESLPVDKQLAPTAADAPLAERTDRLFLGTAVSSGTGTAEVTAIGMATELGRIATLLASADDGETPLQVQLAGVGRSLVWLCLGVVGVVAAAGLAHGQPWLEVLLVAVPLAVAAVPEGLPAVVTVALAVGVRRMAARNVLVRRLPAVETLGAATVILTDKTGTLTTGVMGVREVWSTDPDGVLYAAAACAEASLGADDAAPTGDPTEVALLIAARARGFDRATIEATNPRVAVLPFDADRKRMSILRADGRLYVKGAFDVLGPRCRTGLDGADAVAHRMAAAGSRVLAVADGSGPDEDGLRLLGLVALADPPRPEAITAIADARRAGIVTVVVTGDHPVTARAIAVEMGIDPDQVHARVSPADKLRIVREWKGRGAVTAMTGDGVNDAPALREAHVGIAMGRGGTEVTREAADLVLADDNFASIVEGIREGRGIFENIRNTVVYLLGGNTGELLVMLVAAVAGLPLPLLPLHLLWINLVTDGLPALALATEPPPPDVLTRPPRPVGERMLDRAAWARIVAFGVVDGAVVLGVFVAHLDQGVDAARTLAFATLVFAELFRAFAARSPTLLFWEIGVGSNLRLVAVVLGSVALQLAVHTLPWARSVFALAPASLSDLGLALGLGLVPVTVFEAEKLARRWLTP